MNAPLQTPDYFVLAASLAAMLAVGLWTGRGSNSSDEWLLAGRRLPWWSAAGSLALAGLAAVVFCAGPNEAYWVGLKLLMVPVLVWAALPLVLWCVVPLYGNLGLDSAYEYLELRFDPTTRGLAAALYVAGTVLWIGGVMALPCTVIRPGSGLDPTTVSLVVGMGLVATAYTSLGGMRAAVWTDLIQLGLMAAGLLVLILAVAASLESGLPGIWPLAQQLGRTKIVEATHGWSPQWSASAARWSFWSAHWSIWAVVPYVALLSMFFFVGDQATLQRLLAVRTDRHMALSYLVGGFLFTLLAGATVYVGLGLLAVYHEGAQAEIPPQWVVNSPVDPASGGPFVGPDTRLDAKTIARLAAEGAILDPNTGGPLAETGQLINARGDPMIDRLATRSVRKYGGEHLLRAGGDRLFGHFVARHLRFGLAGLVLAALVAAAMAALDSALTALGAVVLVDFHRRFGWAERWLARRCDKPPDELDQTDELTLGRPVVWALGTLIILVSLAVAALGNVLDFVFGVLGILAGPLLGVFLLGLFTRRTTAAAARAGMLLGVAVALWATLGDKLAAAAATESIWPFQRPLRPFWPAAFAVAATLLAGYGLSFLVGSRKSRQQLSGLVAGLGRWGVLLDIERQPKEEEIYWIEIDDDESPPPGTWS